MHILIGLAIAVGLLSYLTGTGTGREMLLWGTVAVIGGFWLTVEVSMNEQRKSEALQERVRIEIVQQVRAKDAAARAKSTPTATGSELFVQR